MMNKQGIPQTPEELQELLRRAKEVLTTRQTKIVTDLGRVEGHIQVQQSIKTQLGTLESWDGIILAVLQDLRRILSSYSVPGALDILTTLSALNAEAELAAGLQLPDLSKPPARKSVLSRPVEPAGKDVALVTCDARGAMILKNVLGQARDAYPQTFLAAMIVHYGNLNERLKIVGSTPVKPILIWHDLVLGEDGTATGPVGPVGGSRLWYGVDNAMTALSHAYVLYGQETDHNYAAVTYIVAQMHRAIAPLHPSEAIAGFHHNWRESIPQMVEQLRRDHTDELANVKPLSRETVKRRREEGKA